jgi:hypothetical protein
MVVLNKIYTKTGDDGPQPSARASAVRNTISESNLRHG